MENGRVVVGEVQAVEFDFTAELRIWGSGQQDGWLVGDFRFLLHDFIDALKRGGAALEYVDDPAERDHRPSELDHVGQKRAEVSDGDAVR